MCFWLGFWLNTRLLYLLFYLVIAECPPFLVNCVVFFFSFCFDIDTTALLSLCVEKNKVYNLNVSVLFCLFLSLPALFLLLPTPSSGLRFGDITKSLNESCKWCRIWWKVWLAQQFYLAQWLVHYMWAGHTDCK